MQSTGRVAYSEQEENQVKIGSLFLEGANGRVRACVDNRMLSLENKLGHGLDIKINSITRVNHHHTRLIPFGFAALGLGLIWTGVRILSMVLLQFVSITVGAGLVIGWLGTRKPTLTIDTEIGDCHVITGADSSLLKLTTLLSRLQRGYSLSDAKEGLEFLGTSTEYPRDALLENQVPINTVEVSAPESIASFLATDLVESLVEDEIIEPSLNLDMFDMPPEPTQVLPDWLNSPARDNSVSANNSTNSLIQRGIENVGDRRNRQLSEEMSLFNQIDPQLPSQVINNVPTPSSSLLAKANERPDLEAGRSILPEPLPNFCSKEGFHVPNQIPASVPSNNLDMFTSPDNLLGPVDDLGVPTTSLVAGARKANNPPQQIRQNLSDAELKSTRLRPKAPLNNTRLRRKVPRVNERRGLVGRLMPAATRIANSVRDAGNNLADRIISNLEESEQTTTELRERSSEGENAELESLRKLAVSNGGHLPDEKVRQLEEIVKRRNSIAEQYVEDNEDDLSVSFGDFVETTEGASNSDSLPRIDL